MWTKGMKQLFDWRKSCLAVWLWIRDPTLPSWSKSNQPNVVSTAWSPFTLHHFPRPGRCCESLGPRALHDVNSLCFDDQSISLHLASREGHVEVARLIVEHGADSAAQDK